MGTLGSFKKSSLVVVKKKSPALAGSAAVAGSGKDARTTESSESSITNLVDGGSRESGIVEKVEGSVENGSGSVEKSSESVEKSKSEAPSSGLLGLGAYSDSDESD